MNPFQYRASESKLGPRHTLQETEHGRLILDVLKIDYDRNAPVTTGNLQRLRGIKLLPTILDGIIRNDEKYRERLT